MPFRPENRDAGHARLDPGASSTPRPPQAADGLPAALPALLTFSSLLDELRLKKSALAKAGADEGQIRNEVLQFIAERALAISGASGIAIALAEGQEIVCRGTAGDTAPPLGLALNLQSGLTAICFTTGTVVRCDDSETDNRVDRQACRELGIRSVVAVPLRNAQGVRGLIEAFEKQAFAFTDGDIRELSLLAELTVEAIRKDAPKPQSPPVSPAQAGMAAPARPDPLQETFPEQLPKQQRTAPQPPAWHGQAMAGQSTSLGDWTQLTATDQEQTTLALSVDSRQQTVSPVVPASKRNQPTPSFPVATQEPTRPWRTWGFSAAGILMLAGGVWSWHGYKNPAPSVAVTPVAAPAPTAAQVAQNSALPRITGLRHWSNADASTVVIDLQDEVPYEIHKLSSPDRILVDLHDTALVQELADRNDTVDDPLLSRIKIGQAVPGVSRVELETKNKPNFSVSLEPNPFRLILEIRSLQAPPRPKMDTPTVGQNTSHPTFPEISKNLTTEDAKLRAHVPHLRIVVDAGHGGWDMGTVGRQGLLEKDLALEIAQRLGVLLEQRLGLEVVYTRSDDTFVPLGRRAAIANQVGADLFISVHANYSSQSAARGVETYYTSSGPSTQVLAEEEKEIGTAPVLQMDPSELKSKSDASRKLAASVQQALYGSLSAKGPGVRNRGVKAASFVVLTGTTMPAILAEVSFVSSPADEHNLQDPFYRQNIAEALYRGVARYAAGTTKTNVASANKRNSGL